MIYDPAIKQLFQEYEKSFSALDIKKNGQFFADSFMSAGPNGFIALSRAEFLEEANKAADFYKSVGQTSAKIISADEMPISDQYSMVRVHWGATFRKTGDLPIEFDVSYIVHRSKPEPKIILFIAHQDERQAMKDLGLLSKEQPAGVS